ncbi:MAG: radical SAM protein, partial [Deltaproteobacteria bacterium]|nr:radical SAM protein [Deltaproteobacteria bacterium]
DPYISGLVEPEADGVLLAELGRGCRYRCAFCAYPQGRRTAPAASRPPVQVAELFRWARARGAREVYLLDPSLEQRPDLDELLGLLARVQGGEGIPIFAELRAEAMSTERARALRAAGIRAVEVGLQTLGPEALRLMGRRLDPARFAAGLDALRGEGIRVKVDLMTGLPGDGPAELRRTLDYLGACGALGSVQLFRTQVLPGTPLRRRARALGIRWEDRPPYRVLETPTWPADLLAATAGEVEAATGDDLAALPGPPLAMPPPGPFHRLRYPDGDGIFQYSWDLGDPDGREALARERFRNAGRWCAWWVRGPSPAAEVRLLAAAAGRLLAANPFVSLFVALELGPGEPLDALYALDAALEEGRPSRYLEGLLDGPVRPERRLGVLLPARCRGRLHPGWLAAVRSLAEVLWLAAPRDTGEASAVAAAMDLAEGEYLLLDLPDGVAMPGPEALPDPCRVIPLGLSRAWDWQERVDRRAGTDL